jgi:large subunit ribosomal protein L1
MAQRSRRYTAAFEKREKAAPNKAPLPLADAVKLLKELDPVKFDETVNLALQLGIDTKQSTQNVRGSFSLPHGIGRTARVIAFAEGDDAEAARKAGAVEVGAADLVKKIEDGWADFEVAVAHPRLMRFVGKLGKVLGPQGKMPSPKSGTVTEDVASAVAEFRAGKVELRNDKGGSVHLPVGKRSFTAEALAANIAAVIEFVGTLRPRGVKGAFIQHATVSTTMSPGIRIAI